MLFLALKKGLNGLNHFFSGSHYQIKKFSQQNFQFQLGEVLSPPLIFIPFLNLESTIFHFSLNDNPEIIIKNVFYFI